MWFETEIYWRWPNVFCGKDLILALDERILRLTNNASAPNIPQGFQLRIAMDSGVIYTTDFLSDGGQARILIYFSGRTFEKCSTAGYCSGLCHWISIRCHGLRLYPFTRFDAPDLPASNFE